MRLSNHEPEATSIAKSLESPNIDIVISRKAPAKTARDLLTVVMLRKVCQLFPPLSLKQFLWSSRILDLV